jgi:hypothetical protein
MEGVVRYFPDWWRRPSPIKHLRSEPGQPELHTEGNRFREWAANSLPLQARDCAVLRQPHFSPDLHGSVTPRCMI